MKFFEGIVAFLEAVQGGELGRENSIENNHK